MLKKIKWIDQSCVKILLDNDKIIYFDPYNIIYKDKADYIFITHDHYDHFSENDILKLLKKDTIIVAAKGCKSDKFDIAHYVKPFDEIVIDNIIVKTIPAYNKKKNFHPKSNDWVGYILKIDGFSVYHTGDTDIIPEMKEAEGVDIALVAIGGTYTMNAYKAVEAVNNIIKPKKAIPIHWGAVVGSEHDAHIFINSVNCKSEILR